MVISSSPEVLAIVQARGGSKSLPRKNIRSFAGHPLIAYSIAAALAAKKVSRLIVSTDDDEIAVIAQIYGAEVPFLRPSELAQDHSCDLSLFQHALHWLEDHEGYKPDMVVQLRPTSPLRPVSLIDQSIDTLFHCPEADCVRSVTPPNQNPYKMWRDGEDGLLEALMTGEFDEPYNMPRQHLPKVYWQTGHIDVIRSKTISFKNSMTGDKVLPILVDRLYCVDIDNEDDWIYAEWLLAHKAISINLPKD